MKIKLYQLRIMPFLFQMNRSSKYCHTNSQVGFHKKVYLVSRQIPRCGGTITGTVPLPSACSPQWSRHSSIHSFIHSTNVCQAWDPALTTWEAEVLASDVLPAYLLKIACLFFLLERHGDFQRMQCGHVELLCLRDSRPWSHRWKHVNLRRDVYVKNLPP